MISHDVSNLHDHSQQHQYSMPTTMASIPQVQPVTTQMPTYDPTGPNFVTSSMWRDTVASTYDPGGNKRRWDVDSSYLVDPAQAHKRPR